MVKAGVVIIVLSILLVLSLTYIIYTKYSQWQLTKQISTFQQGVQAGYEQAIVQIVQQVSTCNQVPLRIGNQTTNIIAIDCLQGNR